MGVTCARKKQCDAAISHIEACYAIQQAILEDANEIVQNTAYYLDSLRIDSLTSERNTFNNDHGACKPDTTPNEIHHVIQNAPQRLKSQPNFSNDRQENTEPLVATKPVIKQRVSRIDSKPTYLTRSGPNLGQSEQISYPMICLGSLQVEARISERIHHSLEGYSGSLALQSFGGVRELSLLCRRPAIASKHKTMSQNIIHCGVLTMKKRERLRVSFIETWKDMVQGIPILENPITSWAFCTSSLKNTMMHFPIWKTLSESTPMLWVLNIQMFHLLSCSKDWLNLLLKGLMIRWLQCSEYGV